MSQGKLVGIPNPIGQVMPGDGLSARKQNQIIDAVNLQVLNVPMNHSLVRLAETVAEEDPEGSEGLVYPSASAQPIKYAFRFIYLDPSADAVLQASGSPTLDPESRETISGYVVNIEGCGINPYVYIPEGTIISVVAGPGHYWTSYRGTGGGTLYIFSLLPGRSDKFIGDILEVDGEALVAEDQTIEDPLSIFTDLFDAESAEGLCLFQGGKYWAIQAKCPTTAGAS